MYRVAVRARPARRARISLPQLATWVATTVPARRAPAWTHAWGWPWPPTPATHAPPPPPPPPRNPSLALVLRLSAR